jgi:hypothetical protein
VRKWGAAPGGDQRDLFEDTENLDRTGLPAGASLRDAMERLRETLREETLTAFRTAITPHGFVDAALDRWRQADARLDRALLADWSLPTRRPGGC